MISSIKKLFGCGGKEGADADLSTDAMKKQASDMLAENKETVVDAIDKAGGENVSRAHAETAVSTAQAQLSSQGATEAAEAATEAAEGAAKAATKAAKGAAK